MVKKYHLNIINFPFDIYYNLIFNHEYKRQRLKIINKLLNRIMKKRQYYNFEDYIDRYTFKDMNNHIKEINKEIEESNEMIKTIRE